MKTDRQTTINNNLRDYVNINSKRHRLGGINRNNTYAHEKAKLLKAFDLAYNEGCEVLIEPILNNGYRPDVLVLDTETPIAYEIVCTENEESLLRKQVNYQGIKIVPIRINEVSK